MDTLHLSNRARNFHPLTLSCRRPAKRTRGRVLLEKRGCNLSINPSTSTRFMVTDGKAGVCRAGGRRRRRRSRRTIPFLFYPLAPPLNMQEEHRWKFTFSLKFLEPRRNVLPTVPIRISFRQPFQRA